MDDLLDALRASLDDERLSRGERKALRSLVEARALDAHERNLLRAEAFDLARAAIDAPQADAVLGWLKDVLGILVPLEGVVEGGTRTIENEAWFSPGADPLRALVRELRRVRKTADVCVFTITDDRISDGLVGIARRGVRVRVVTDGAKAGDRGSDVDRLLEAGIALAVDDSDAHMHHKYAVFDGMRLLTGSFNWTRAATHENSENLLLTTEPTLVRAYAGEFDRLWSRYGPHAPPA